MTKLQDKKFGRVLGAGLLLPCRISLQFREKGWGCQPGCACSAKQTHLGLQALGQLDMGQVVGGVPQGHIKGLFYTQVNLPGGVVLASSASERLVTVSA
jgi:hypothetical protein